MIKGFNRMAQAFATRFQDLKHSTHVFTPIIQRNSPAQTRKLDLSVKYLSQEWLNQIIELDAKKVTLQQAKEVLDQFSKHGASIVDHQRPENIKRVFEQVLMLSATHNIQLQLEEIRWLYSLLNHNLILIPLLLSYFSTLPDQSSFVTFINNIGLCKPDIQMSILSTIYEETSQELRRQVMENLPEIKSLYKTASITKIERLLKKENRLKSIHCQQIQDQLCFLISRDQLAQLLRQPNPILNLFNSSCSITRTIDEANLSKVIVRLTSDKFVNTQFLFSLLDIISQKTRIDLNSIITGLSSDNAKLELLPVASANLIQQLISNIGIDTFVNFLKNKDPVQRYYYFTQFSKQGKEFIRKNAKFYEILSVEPPSIIFLQLVAEFANEPKNYEEKIHKSVEKLNKLSPMVFHSLLQITLKSKIDFNKIFTDKFSDVFSNHRILIQVMNKVCDEFESENLRSIEVLPRVAMNLYTMIKTMEQEDSQRLLYLVQKLPLTQKQFAEIQQQFIEGVKYLYSGRVTLTKVIAILYSVAFVKRQYGFIDQEFIDKLEMRVCTQSKDLSGKQLFSLYKCSLYDNSLALLQQEIKRLVQQGRLDGHLQGLINYTANEIKHEQYVYPNMQLVNKLEGQILSLEGPVRLELVQEISNLMIKIERHGKLTQALIDKHKLLVQQLPAVLYHKAFHIALAQLLYSEKPLQLIENIQLTLLRNFDLIQLYQFILQAQLTSSDPYNQIRRLIKSKQNLFSTGSELENYDKGLLALAFYSASLDPDLGIFQFILATYRSFINDLIDTITENVECKKQQKTYGSNMNDNVSQVNLLQLYQGALYARMQGINDPLIDKILSLQTMVQTLSQNSKLNRVSKLEKDIITILKELYPETQFSEEYDELEPFTIDIYIPSSRVAIECDGFQHRVLGQLKRSDVLRDQYIQSKGIKVKRIFVSDWKSATTQQQQNIIKDLCL